MTANRIDLIDEDDAWRVSLSLIEEIAHTRGTDTHEHLDEFRATDGKERHARLAADRLGEKRLAGARGPDQQDALRNPSAQHPEVTRALDAPHDLSHLL